MIIPLLDPLLAENVRFLFHTAYLMILIGFIYGYAISFIFGIKKTLLLSFFVIILACTFIFLFISGYLVSTTCFGQPTNPCFTFRFFIVELHVWLFSLLSNFFTNFLVGYLSVFFGIILYFPSEWTKQKYFSY